MDNIKPMPAYRSHKKVWALRIATVVHCGTDTTTDENKIVEIHFEDSSFQPKRLTLEGKPTPECGWYYVKYENGYESFSPREVFENGNTPESELGLERGTGTIGWALKQLHNRAKVARAGWNGKGMFLILVPGSRFQVNRPPLLGVFPEGTEVSYRPHVDMKTVDGEIVPWVCSQSDLLATDWEIAE